MTLGHDDSTINIVMAIIIIIIMDQYASSPGHTNYTVTQNTCILYQLPPLLLAIFWILWCTGR